MTYEIDWEKVDQLLIAGCKGTEIAGYLGMHPETLYRRVEEEKKVGFGVYLQEKRSKGDSLLRAHQYAKAMGLTDKGENSLLIWLGKVRLEQKEHIEPGDIEKEKKFDQKMDQVLALLSSPSDLNIEESNINNETKS
jgi:hypothetical protein